MMRFSPLARPLEFGGALVLAAAMAACGDSGGTAPELEGPLVSDFQCTLEPRYLLSGARRDAIPALSDPPLASQADPTAFEYLAQDDRVVGFFLDGRPVAIPLNILFHHEIVNLSHSETKVAVTFCPLTGTSLVFDRSVVGGAEFGVSGLLYQSNLILYDRTSEASFWPQMMGQARCGPASGQVLPRLPAWEMEWGAWQRLHPQTLTVSEDTGFDRNYLASGNPYAGYDAPSSSYWFTMPPLDRRLLPKERVLGLPSEQAGEAVAFPFPELDELGARGVVRWTFEGRPVVVLWRRDGAGAAAYEGLVDGATLDLTATPDGFLADDGTLYGVDGLARSGPRRGTSLTPIATSYTSYWGAWAAFYDTQVWETSGAS